MTPSNVSTLQSENLHLVNHQLQNNIKNKEITNDGNQLVISKKNNDFMKLQNDMNFMKQSGMKYISDIYSKIYQKSTGLYNIQSKNISSKNVRFDTFSDNIDVPTSTSNNCFETKIESPILSPTSSDSETSPPPLELDSDSDVSLQPLNIIQMYQPLMKTRQYVTKQKEVSQENSNYNKKVKIYIDLNIKKNLTPNQSVINSNNVSTINKAIKI